MINSKKLRSAIKLGDVKQIKELLRAAPKGDIRLYHEWTPLHLAVKAGKKEVVAAILDTGAQINATTDGHQTPLDMAMKLGHKAIAEFLQSKGARAGAALSLHPAVAAGDIKAVRKHVAAGADINQVINGELPLGIALNYHHWDVANYLLNRKCDVTATQQGYETPLHIAAAKGTPEDLLKKLLKLGAHIDAVDEYRRTPLCDAAEAGDVEMVNWLLDHGADIAFGNEQGTTPVSCALRENHDELAAYLIDRGGKSTFSQAVQCNHLARARQKLSAGADANHQEDERYFDTPLGVTIWKDLTDMAALLLEFGADPNLQDRASQGEHGMLGGNTSLHDAVYKGSAKMVKLLLAHGADPDITNADGLTPIELAHRRDRSHLAHLMEAHIDKKLSLEATQTGIEPLYTVQKVAELLSVDVPFVLDLIKARKITGLQLDEKTTRITGGSIQRYLAKLVNKSPAN